MFQKMWDFFNQNAFIGGAGALLVGGSLLGFLYKAWNYLIRFLRYLCFTKVSFESVDHLGFKKIQYYLYNLPYSKKRCPNFNIRYVRKGNYGSNKEEQEIFYPGHGTHYLFILGRPALITYIKSDSKELAYRETIDITIFSIFNKTKIVERLLKEINNLFDDIEYSGTSIYACTNTYGEWTELHSKKIRQHPIFSSKQEYDNIIEDINKFLTNEKWYEDRGISYKRGYLLSGKPGTGKTSTILSLAQHFKKHVYIINLSSAEIDDAKFIELVTSLGKDAILAIEDIDAVTIDRESSKEGDKEINRVTLSTLLNTLDGLLSPDGLLFFLTTNYPEKLDKALIRPGRISYYQNFNYANEYQSKQIFLRFFPDAEDKYINQFISSSVDKPMSLLESHLVKNSLNIEKASNLNVS